MDSTPRRPVPPRLYPAPPAPAAGDRLRGRAYLSTLVDVTLGIVATVTALATILAPPTGPLDGRHVLAIVAVLILTVRTIRRS